MIRLLAALALVITLAPVVTKTVRADLPAEPWRDPLAYLEKATTAACFLKDIEPETLSQALGGAELLEQRALGPSQQPLGWRRNYRLPGGDQLVLIRQGPPDLLHRFFIELYQDLGQGQTTPLAMAIAGSDCRIFHGRRLRRDATGQILDLELLGPGLEPSGEVEALNPPVPAGKDPGGIPVALFDSGINYTLPRFAERLARNAEGEVLGYDFWDLDKRPFDSHPFTSPFLPQRHGTAVASILLAEAPETKLLPFRYPRPDMSRMTQMVEAAAKSGTVIAAMPMGSNRESDWTAFAEAAKRHPELLFIVSAGNNGRDIDQDPLYPAVFTLDNLLVVSSSDRTGRPAPGSNWGVTSVDLLVPAEQLTVVDFSGLPGEGSGSSFAVTRIAALAARLKQIQPSWSGPALKRAILELAVPAAHPPTTRHGWLPDPTVLP